MDIALAKLIGLGVLFVIFVITVLLMPRILGENPPSATAATPGDAEQPAPAVPAAATETEPAAPRRAEGFAKS